MAKPCFTRSESLTTLTYSPQILERKRDISVLFNFFNTFSNESLTRYTAGLVYVRTNMTKEGHLFLRITIHYAHFPDHCKKTTDFSLSLPSLPIMLATYIALVCNNFVEFTVDSDTVQKFSLSKTIRYSLYENTNTIFVAESSRQFKFFKIRVL